MKRLKPIWSTELDEYFEERYGIDIGKVICDEVLKTIRDENKLGSDWSLEIAEYMNERYGIDIFEVVRDEIQKANLNENQKDKEKLK